MKKIVILVLSLFSYAQIFGQKQYTDKNEYESALKYYNDAKDSYENYLKKINYYKNYKYPKNKTYPTDPEKWYSLWEKDLRILNIRSDNNEKRLHNNIIPEDSLYIHFIEVPDSAFLVVRISNKKMSKYDFKFCAKTLKFKHPGKPPIYIEKKNIENITIVEDKKEKEIIQKIDSTIIEVKIKNLYLMPDGKKYTYEELIINYPCMAIKEVFLSYFKN